MISEAERIALGEVTKVEVLANPHPGVECVWWPNREVTLKVAETWRGELPETIKVRVSVDLNYHPEIQVGDQAVVFVGCLRNVGEKLPEDCLPVYEGAQGFFLAKDLVYKGNEDAQKAALKTLGTAVKAYRKPAHRNFGITRIFLNDEALAPFIKLLSDPDEHLQYWALRMLDYVAVNKDLGERMVALLESKSEQVRTSAAYRLAEGPWVPALGPLLKFKDTLPKIQNSEFLKNKIVAFSVSARLQQHLEKFEPAQKEAILRRFEKLPEGEYRLILLYKMDTDGRLAAILDTRKDRGNDLTEQLLPFFQKLDPPDNALRPNTICILIQRTGDNLVFYVRATLDR